LKALFLTGPTAVGKTGIALQVAGRCNGEIIGADAFQVYQGLNLLTAKPSQEELRRVKHHLIGTVPPAESFDVAQYLAAATRYADEIASRGKLPIFVGGTGLYIRALTRGLADLPKADAATRAELEAAGLEELQKRYTALDPEGAKKIDLKNKRRLVRAIEVCLLTGRPFSAFREEWETKPAPVTGFFLTRDRDDLHRRINRRVAEMFRNGVVEEVRALAHVSATAAQAIGFKEIRALLDGGISESECIERIQQATRQYARRQITWFKRETMFETVNLSTHPDLESVVQLIERKAGE
jgi:tRNA dimethylallyltransferase